MTWQDKVVDKVARKPRHHESMNTPFGPALKPLQFAATVKFMRFINDSAQVVGVNRSTYVRRVLAVHASSVLKVPVRMILWESPKPRRWGEHYQPSAQAAGQRDDGEGIESWCPHPGCDGTHLSVPNSGRGAALP